MSCRYDLCPHCQQTVELERLAEGWSGACKNCGTSVAHRDDKAADPPPLGVCVNETLGTTDRVGRS